METTFWGYYCDLLGVIDRRLLRPFGGDKTFRGLGGVRGAEQVRAHRARPVERSRTDGTDGALWRACACRTRAPSGAVYGARYADKAVCVSVLRWVGRHQQKPVRRAGWRGRQGSAGEVVRGRQTAVGRRRCGRQVSVHQP